MIARLWTGQVPAGKATRYIALMNDIAIPEYRAVAGNLGAWCLTRSIDELVEVRMLTFWRDLDAIRAFAGEDVAAAKYYPFDPDFLLAMPEIVEHFDVVSPV